MATDNLSDKKYTAIWYIEIGKGDDDPKQNYAKMTKWEIALIEMHYDLNIHAFGYGNDSTSLVTTHLGTIKKPVQFEYWISPPCMDWLCAVILIWL